MHVFWKLTVPPQLFIPPLSLQTHRHKPSPTLDYEQPNLGSDVFQSSFRYLEVWFVSLVFVVAFADCILFTSLGGSFRISDFGLNGEIEKEGFKRYLWFACKITQHCTGLLKTLLCFLVGVFLGNTRTNFFIFLRLLFVLLFNFLLLLLFRGWWSGILLGHLLCHQLRIDPRFSTTFKKRGLIICFINISLIFKILVS